MRRHRPFSLSSWGNRIALAFAAALVAATYFDPLFWSVASLAGGALVGLVLGASCASRHLAAKSWGQVPGWLLFIAVGTALIVPPRTHGLDYWAAFMIAATAVAAISERRSRAAGLV